MLFWALVQPVIEQSLGSDLTIMCDESERTRMRATTCGRVAPRDLYPWYLTNRPDYHTLTVLAVGIE